MKTVIITGAGGYIGSRLTPFLIEKGYKIRAVDRFFFGNNLKKNQNLEIIKNDIRLIKDDIFKNANYLIDLAAISNDVSGERFEKETFDINYKASKNQNLLVELCLMKLCTIKQQEKKKMNNSKIEKLTGFKPEVDIRQGLQKTIDWITQPHNLNSYKSEIYNV